MKTILFKKSDGEVVLLPFLTLGQLNDLYIWRASHGKYSEIAKEKLSEHIETGQLWINKYLEDLFPDMTPFDREAAFITVYGPSVGKEEVRVQAGCPSCGKTTQMIYNMRQDLEREFYVDIPNSAYRVHFKTPSTPGGKDGGPSHLSEIDFIDYTKEEAEADGIRPTFNDEITTSTGRIPYTPLLEWSVLHHKDTRRVPLEEVDAEDKKVIAKYIDTFQMTRFKAFSSQPFKVPLRFRCNCGFRDIRTMTRVYEFLMTAISPNATHHFMPFIEMSVLFAEKGIVSVEEYKKLTYLESSMILIKLEKQAEEAKKHGK